MKKISSLLMAMVLVLSYGVFALGSSESSTTADQGSGKVSEEQSNENVTTDQGSDTASESKVDDSLGEYSVVIDSCRLAKDFQGKDIVIVKYIFTNNEDADSTSFSSTFEDNAYQNGVGLNECYVVDDDANYSNDNQMKEIKKGASLDVEVAYELNDNTTDVEIEVKELFSFSDKTLTKTFKISQ